ncbi:hypothetical protein DPEC_G00203590 [Dallia pectoralis]|uniref:Uncharacterized protein n=1 Tax=Dallia pectoralis TaxID=75939 RepID=A0ACC2G9M1_DALPE|nr:hypothetical protein DPEC_G00203590 [Dallia pectoralis]
MELDMLDIEQVILGEDVLTSSTASIKSQTVPAPVYQHDSLQCFQCFITFCNPKSKERHMRKSHREEYNQSLQQTNTLFTCYVCDRTFPTSEELTQHQASHSLEDKPFRCPHCQESFRTFSELTIHRRTLCKERQFLCKDCGMAFRGPYQLRTHRLSQHSHTLEEEDDDSKTHRCGKCGRGFETEEELVMHQENFAGEQHCDGKLRKRGRPVKKVGDSERESANGEKIVPLKEEDLQIPCPEAECDLTFSSLAILRAHKKEKHKCPSPTRKAHRCSECEESYARPGQLKAHKARAHISGRHNCPTCGKSFGRESNLKAHLKSHTENKEVTDREKT